MKHRVHNVELSRQGLGTGRWRASYAPAPGRKSINGYGPSIPAALTALARAIEHWAVKQLETLGVPPADTTTGDGDGKEASTHDRV